MVNKAIILGYAGADPELRYTSGGTAVANLNVATTRKWKDGNGDKQEETEWHRIVLWKRQAEVAKEFVNKGSLVYIEGRIQTRSWEDKDGTKKYTTEIIADRIQLIGGKSDKPAKDDDEELPFDDDSTF